MLMPVLVFWGQGVQVTCPPLAEGGCGTGGTEPLRALPKVAPKKAFVPPGNQPAKVLASCVGLGLESVGGWKYLLFWSFSPNP